MNSEKYVLSVDDSSVVRKIIKGTVEEYKLSFLEAADGNQALASLKRYGKDIKLVLLDWNMPNMNGIEFLERIRKISYFDDIPILMVTTESDKKNVIRAVQAGAQGYVVKPFTDEDLKRKINPFFMKGGE